MNSRLPRPGIVRSIAFGFVLAACGGNGGSETTTNQHSANTTTATAESISPSTSAKVGRAVLILNPYDIAPDTIQTYPGVTTADEHLKPVHVYPRDTEFLIECQTEGRPPRPVDPAEGESERPPELQDKGTLWFKLYNSLGPGPEFARAWYADPVNGYSETFPRPCTPEDLQG